MGRVAIITDSASDLTAAAAAEKAADRIIEDVWGKDKEWDSEITEQVPDQVIAWRSVSSGSPIDFCILWRAERAVMSG